MLIPTTQMRAPSKRWIVVAGVLVTSLVSIAWSFDRFVLHARGFAGAPASVGKTADRRKPAPGTDISSPSSAATLMDSDNDGIPGTAELRTFQDRESFRRWFTSVAEIQFYQLSEQWNVDQRDCAG